MDLDAFRGWLQRYFDAWASNDPVEVSALFAEDAVYSFGPFREETHGREAIVRAWVEGGVPTDLRTDVEPIAVAGDRGVAHWRVSFRDDAGSTVGGGRDLGLRLRRRRPVRPAPGVVRPPRNTA
jgi:ketosteroid isomerase-like protein